MMDVKKILTMDTETRMRHEYLKYRETRLEQLFEWLHGFIVKYPQTGMRVSREDDQFRQS